MFSGGASLTGDLLLPGTPTIQLNGNATYGSTVDGGGAASPTAHKVTLSGGAALGRVVRRTDAISLPTVPASLAPAGTRNVALNNATDSPGDFSTLRDLTLNGNVGAIPVPPGTYGDFTANGTNRFTLGVAGATMPAVYHFQRLTITLDGNTRLVGGVAADSLIVKGSALLRLLAPPLPFLANFDGRTGHQAELKCRSRGSDLVIRRDHPQTEEDDWEVVDFLRGVGLPWAVLPELLDVRRPVILDVADNSLAIAALNSASALQNIPVSIRCTEIQYAYTRLGLLNRVPIRYSVFEPTGFLGGPLPQLSKSAKEFLLTGGDQGDVAFIGDGLIPRANQRFTQLTGFSAVALPARVITGREVVHIEAPKQTVDLLEQLKSIAPEMFP